ncbi:nucleotide pyrophosphohydrolase [Shewanella algae]
MLNTNIDELQHRLRAFTEERNWAQFHSPKNLAMAMTVEVAELVEIFQWMTEVQSQKLSQTDLQRVSEEIADIFLYLLMLSDKLDVDLITAANKKIELNAEKYPVDKCFGKSDKYDQL